jgi:glycosyltransferase involved in cell wall biosynthesis
MKLTVITINLNNRLGLEKTITSVTGQTFHDFEYIIIDGGSSDGSVDVLTRHKSALSYWISEPDRGIYHAMNKGIAKAKADYVLFLNSGDLLLSPNTLEKMAPTLGTADIVYGNLRMISGSGYKEHAYPALLTFSYFLHHSIGHPAAFIKRTLFREVGLYDENMKICADWGFFIRAIGLFHASYQHVPVTVAVFHTDGISCQASNRDSMRQEQRILLQNDFSFFETDYESYHDLKENLDAIRRSKPYKFLKLLGLPKYQT